MRYFYVDENDHTAGPVEENSFYEAMRIHVLEPDTQVVAEGTEEWQTLAAVLSYYFTFGDGSAGPLPLAKLMRLAAASPDPLLVMEPGGSEWVPLDSLLSASAGDTGVEPEAEAVASAPVLAALRELKAENEALKRRLTVVEERVRLLTPTGLAAAQPDVP